MNFLLGTYTKHNSLGIYTGSIFNNKLENLSFYEQSSNPSYLDYYDGFIFSTYSDFKYGGVSVFKNNTLITQILDEGKGPSHISYSPKLKMVFTANYNRGEIRSYSFKNNQLKLLETIFLGENSHAHQIFYNQKLRRVIVCDLGLDTIFVYKVSILKKLILDYKIKLPIKSGPRHAVVSNTHNHIYCIAELSNQVFLYDYKKKELLGSYSTILDETRFGQQAAAIRVYEDDLYVSNRGFENTIAHFKIKRDSLLFVASYEVKGKHPRDFNLSKDGNYLVVCNLESNNLSLFKRHHDGSLAFLDTKETLEPTSICFI